MGKFSIEIFLTKTSPLGYFLSDVKEASKNRFFIRRKAFNTLRWHVADSAFLQIPRFTSITATLCFIIPTILRLPLCRYICFAHVRNYHGTTAPQQNGNPSIQWFLSPDAWSGEVSQSVHASSVSQASAAEYHSSICSAPRQLQGLFVFLSSTTPQPDVRSGLYGNRYLRGATTWRGWIQPQETGSKIVSSPALLRSDVSRVLARKSSSRKYRCHDGSDILYQYLPAKGSLHGCKKPNPLSHGLRLLLPANRQLPGGNRLRLRDCRQGIQTDQAGCLCMSISKIAQRLGGCGVSGKNASPREAGSSFRCCETSDHFQGGRRATIDVVQAQKIRLSCLCHQSASQPLAGLSFLQPTGHHRKKHTRTHVRLSIGQNPNIGLDRQCRILSNRVVRRQYRSLVQEDVPASRLSFRNTGHHPNRFPANSCATDQKAQKKYHQASEGLSLQGRVPPSFSNNQEFAFVKKIPNLQTTYEVSLYEKK